MLCPGYIICRSGTVCYGEWGLSGKIKHKYIYMLYIASINT